METVIVRENMAQYTQTDRLTANREWQMMIWETVDKLMRLGVAAWNYETHTPKLVNRGNLQEVFALLGYGDGRLIWQTAYFNIFPPPDGTKGHLSEQSTLKAGFYEHTSPEVIKERGDAAVFLNHNDDGLNEALKEYIKSRFPTPSRFEK